jgi:hypothetical protein
MATNTIQSMIIKFNLNTHLKSMVGMILFVLFIQIQHINAQNLIIQDTTISTTATFSATSISAGPNFTIYSGGDVTLSAKTIAILPRFSIIRGGKLHVIAEGSPVNVTAENQIIPVKFMMLQNYPNPFNPRTIINYELPFTNYVELSIYTIMGQKVATLINERQQAGFHQVEWYASGFASGIYYYMLKAGEFHDVKKMIMLR